MTKPKVGFYWCASCGGCEEAVVDLAEGVLDVVAAVDIVFWPVALDFKRADVEALPDGGLAVAFVNGAIRTSEQEEMAELLRRKAQTLIAFGSCAHLGGIPGLGNLHSASSIMSRVYGNSGNNWGGDGAFPKTETTMPEGELELPTFRDSVRTLAQTVEVDYFLPGCPPPVELIKKALDAILTGSLPEKGSVLAPNMALCNECVRRDTKPDNLALNAIRRPHQFIADSTQCLLAQGLLCLGPATRAGCGAACVSANMPCSGCLGPTDGVADQGGKALSALASILEPKDEATLFPLLDQIVDPVGTLYRYSLPGSLMRRRTQPSTPL